MHLALLALLAAAPQVDGGVDFLSLRPAAKQPLPGVEWVELFSGDKGERVSLLRVTSGTHLQLDQAQPVLAVVLTGELSLSSGERPRVVFGEAGRCEPAQSVTFGTELLVVQPRGASGPVVGPPGKQQCKPGLPVLTRSERPLNESFPLGARGSVQFFSITTLAYAGKLNMNGGAKVDPHQHDTSAELLYLLDGGGTVTVDGATAELEGGDALRIAAGRRHAFVAGPQGVRAIQLYAPPGPQERFRPPPPAPPPSVEARCQVDGDCALVDRELTGPLACCPSCAAVAGTTTWAAAVQKVCAALNESTTPCVPRPCGPVDRRARCVKGQCVAGR